MPDHNERVSTLSSTWDLLSSSGRDNQIINHDLRERNQSKHSPLLSQDIVSMFDHHTQEVCGLKWSSTIQTLASGANDNLVLLWDKRQMKLRHRCEGHTAAVKAIAWCPWQQNILVSGGGTNDKKLNLWNADTGDAIRTVETGSQVCAV